jgi:hypothetical protein
MVFTGRHHLVRALEAGADMFNGDPSSDIIDLSKYDRVTFLLQKGAGAVGTATVTVHAADDTSGTTNCAMAFRYRANTSGDTWGDLTDADTGGFTTTAGANQMYAVEVSADEVLEAGRGHSTPFDGKCVYLTLTEVADDPCVGGVAAVLSKGRYQDDSMPSAI